jgi:hypothetical protein
MTRLGGEIVAFMATTFINQLKSIQEKSPGAQLEGSYQELAENS